MELKTVKQLRDFLDNYEDDLPVYKYVNLNFDYHDPEDHVLEDICLIEKRVYFDKDDKDYKVANRPSKKTQGAIKALII